MAKRFDKHQIDALMAAFEESEHLTKQKKIELGTATGLDVEQVASWFNRTRAHKRARESVGDLNRTNAELEQALRESQEMEAKLQKELEESKRREAKLQKELEESKRREAKLQKELEESKRRGEAKLQKELEESKRREAELGAENQHLRQQLGMDGGDSQFDPMVTAIWSVMTMFSAAHELENNENFTILGRGTLS